MTQIEINAQPVLDALARLKHAGQNLHPVMDAIGQVLESRISHRFETQSDPDGAAWAAWKPATVKTYPKDGNRRILDRYGDMLTRLTHLAQDDSVQVGFTASAAWHGESVSPALFHEFGTTNMVRRGLLTSDPVSGKLAEGDQQAILEVLNTHFRRAWGE